MLEWGKELSFLLQIQRDTGMTPPALARKPEVPRDCEPFLQAYFALSQSRGYNEAGRQPLLISEISAYLTLMGITGVDRKARFLTLIQSLDQVALAYYAEQTKRASK